MKKQLILRSILASFGILLFTLGLVTFSHAYNTQNVFIVVIDGIRNTEALKDSSHQYIPNIWNNLCPQGTVYTNFYNNGYTITQPGHSSILTGVWQFMQNEGFGRPKEPTIFEYYRRQQPGVTAWAVVGKNILKRVDYSTYPDYGSSYGATLEVISGSIGAQDNLVWDRVRQVMDASHPSLFLINFPDVDETAHANDWEAYTNAIENVDNIIGGANGLWEKIQSDPIYSGKTTMIVTTDHGRHSDGIDGGFKTHFDDCLGCRDLMFLTLGPDIIPNVTVDAYHEQIDIAPTVGELLGFYTPLAKGKILWEMFMNPAAFSYTLTGPPSGASVGDIRLTNFAGRSQEQDIALIGTNIHIVWTNDKAGNWEIYYKRSTDGGISWSSDVQISNPLRYAHQPAIAVSNTGVVHLVWRQFVDESKEQWRIYYTRSLDGGTTWESPKQLTEAIGIWQIFPRIAADGNYVHVVWAESRYLVSAPNGTVAEFPEIYYKRSADGGTTWASDVKLSNTLNNSLQPDIAVDSKHGVHVTWSDYESSVALWEIYYVKGSNYGNTWTSQARVTNNTGHSYDAVVAADGNSYRMWADNYSGSWEIYGQKSPNYGSTWYVTRQITHSGSAAWSPAMDISSRGNFYLVWTDYRDGNAEVYYMTSSDTNKEIRVTTNAGLSIYPKIAIYSNKAHIVWSDNRDGDWEIYYRGLDIGPSSSTKGLTVAAKSSSQLELSWTASESDVDHYKIYRSTSGGFSIDQDTLENEIFVASSFTNSCLDTGLEASKAYYYQVAAVDEAGNESDPSDEEVGMTNAGSENRMYVQSIDVSTEEHGENTNAVAAVTIVGNGSPVKDAKVEGHWDGLTTSNESFVTDANGIGSSKSGNVKNPEGLFIFTVDNVTEKDYIYESENSENVESGYKEVPDYPLAPRYWRNALFPNYPNPSNPDTWIPYQLAYDAPVTVSIYNAKGQLIRILNIGYQRAGVYVTKDKAAYWDGHNSFGDKVASGMYFYTLRAGEFSATRKIVIMK